MGHAISEPCECSRIRSGHAVAESILTAGKPVGLWLTADRKVLEANGQDLSFVTVEAVDAGRRLQPDADQDLQFAVNGPGEIAAIGERRWSRRCALGGKPPQTLSGARAGHSVLVETRGAHPFDGHCARSKRRRH